MSHTNNKQKFYTHGDLIVCKNTRVKGETLLEGKTTLGKNSKNLSTKLEVNGHSNFEGRVDIKKTTTFHSLPHCSISPQKNYHLVNKEYVDNLLGNGGNFSINQIDKESLLTSNNFWLGSNTYNLYLPTSNLTPTQNNEFTTKEYVDNLFNNINTNPSGDSLLISNNIWTGTNAFNTSLPTSTLTPRNNIDLTNKAYVDSLIGPSLLISNNTWTGTNAFNTSLPTSTLTPTLNPELTTKEYVDNAIASYSGNSATITVSQGSGNNYLTFVSGTSGNQQLFVDSGITYNATTDTLTIPNINVPGTCNATVTNSINAENINITSTTSINTVCSLVLVGNQTTGYQPAFTDTGITYNSTTDTLTVSTINGNLNGTATNATNIDIRSTTSTDTTCSVVLVGNQATGNQQPFIDGGLMYNANTDSLSASSFTGNLIGDVTGNLSARTIRVGSNNGSNINQILMGTGTLTTAGSGRDIITNGTTGISTSSKIFVTFTLSPASISWFYVTPDRDQFIITASGAPTNDATFNWIAYN